jgi:hypothetical protein
MEPMTEFNLSEIEKKLRQMYGNAIPNEIYELTGEIRKLRGEVTRLRGLATVTNPFIDGNLFYGNRSLK